MVAYRQPVKIPDGLTVMMSFIFNSLREKQSDAVDGLKC